MKIDSVINGAGRQAEFTTHLNQSQKPADSVAAIKFHMMRIPIRYSGPEIPPSLRIRQKWIAISTVTITGRKTQCKT